MASEEEGYIASDPYSALYGDTHYYNYKENNWDYRIYPDTRSTTLTPPTTTSTKINCF